MANHIFSELLTWSQELTPWQNEAMRRLFYKGHLSSADLDEIFELAKISFGLKQPSSSPVDLMLRQADIPAAPITGQKLQLKAVRQLENVNLLKNNTRLAIGNQLTVIYGENGSGKSGYARVMKKAFRARAVEDILSNVYAPPSKAPAKAIFEIEENGTLRDEIWIDGSQVSQCLGRFAVCDSKCARVYINEDNQLHFLPYGFDIIDGLGKVTSEVKNRFEVMAKASLPNAEMLKPFIDNTLTGKFIVGISPKTTLEEVESKAVWNDSKTLKEKEVELDRLKSNSPAVLRDLLKIRLKHLQYVRSTLLSLPDISDVKLNIIKGKVLEFIKYKVVVETAAKVTFEKISFDGIGSDVWKELLLSAAKFSEQYAYPKQDFPVKVAGAKCVLCLQDLDSEAQDRLQKFWKFLQDDASSKKDKCAKDVLVETELLKKIPLVVSNEILALEDTLKSAEVNILDEIKQYWQLILARVQGIQEAIKTNNWDSIPIEPKSPVQIIDNEIKTVTDSLLKITDDGKVSGVIKVLSDEIMEYKARERLNANLSLILDYLRNLKASTLASLAANRITTNAISIKASSLQNQFVTEEFKKRVIDELTPICLDRVKTGIEKKSEKGKVLHKIIIDGISKVPLEAVFSEGERTAIALSCFLAELGASEDNCGIIFDDPVSSLDHKIRQKVVDRLVYEAKERQVVVFTHDLVFFTELLESAHRQQAETFVQNLQALGFHTGLISTLPPVDALSIKQRIHKLEETLKKGQEAENTADIESYKQAVGEFYSLLRSTWERAVEECLFNGVVQRLQKNVKTLELDGVNVDDDAVAAIFRGMTRASEMIEAHDHAVAKNTTQPSLQEMEKDIKDFKDFIQEQEGKKRTARAKHASLKTNFLTKFVKG